MTVCLLSLFSDEQHQLKIEPVEGGVFFDGHQLYFRDMDQLKVFSEDLTNLLGTQHG